MYLFIYISAELGSRAFEWRSVWRAAPGPSASGLLQGQHVFVAFWILKRKSKVWLLVNRSSTWAAKKATLLVRGHRSIKTVWPSETTNTEPPYKWRYGDLTWILSPWSVGTINSYWMPWGCHQLKKHNHVLWSLTAIASVTCLFNCEC